ncbi:type II toxin-antitoxin system VapC family toxin [Candidatus Curtissbacteria bacterium]|nr:type II toxin-antitoxin system VapC family toxin [Candidatus Curtissbacteria bacterium]
MIVLDTNALIYLVGNPEKLPQKAAKYINSEIKKNGIHVSSMSIWEIYLLVKKGRLELSKDVDAWLEEVEQLKFINFVPVNNIIAAKSVQLSETVGRDPADRIIAATAVEMGATLITSDQRIRKYPHVQSVW